MKPQPQHILTRKLPFSRTVVLDRARISKELSRMTHVKRDRVEECQADFVLEIDYDGLVRLLSGSAAHNKGGKARIAGGLICLVKRNEKIIRAQEREHPLPAGWKEED